MISTSRRDDAVALPYLARAEACHLAGGRLRWSGEYDAARPLLRQAIVEGNRALDHGHSGAICQRAVAVLSRSIGLLDGLAASRR